MRILRGATILIALLAVSLQLVWGQGVPPSLKQQQEQLKQDYQNLAVQNAAVAEDANAQIRQILTRLGDQVTKYAVDLPLALNDPLRKLDSTVILLRCC
jgi:hypothetical protein